MARRLLGVALGWLALASCTHAAGVEPRKGDLPGGGEATAAGQAVPAAATVAPAATSPAAQAASAAPVKDEAPWLVDKDGPRIGSVGYRTWIWGEPHQARDRLAIGSLRVGTSVKLKSKDPVKGHGCATSKWYAVEPRGFVCADDSTTMNFDSPYWKALATQRPKPGAYPYKYAFSMSAPMYSRVPTPEEQKAAERDMGPTRVFKTLGKWSEGHEKLVTTSDKEGFVTDGPPPDFYKGNEAIQGSPWSPIQPKVKLIPAGSGFAYSRVFEASGRTWLLTPDLFLVPADRVWPYKPSEFKGVDLDDSNNLPLAWVRAPEGVAKLKRDGDSFVATGEKFPGRRPVFLSAERFEKSKKVVYRATKDGLWILDDESVTVVEKKTELKYKITQDERWIEASILGGTMTAFIGTKAVYTTLWSPGLGGVPVPGNDPKKFATTEVGVFPIQWKDAVETMSPDKGAPTVFWFADVPWIQYVHAPMAMHVSYWHESFGYPMSAECLNVSARDGQWLFDFTLPKLPEGWGSVGAGKVNGPSTKINIRP